MMKNLKKHFFLNSVIVLGASAWSLAHAQAAAPLACNPVEGFSGDKVGTFPMGFTSADDSKFKRAVASNAYYRVQEESGNKFLNALSNKDSLTIHRDVKDWNLDQFPLLRWRWRVKQFPTKANEKYIRTNDAAASVYVVWEANALMKVKSIKFTWSSSLDVGTYVSKRFGLDHVQVLRNQNQPTPGQWIEETVDVRALFRKYFEPENGALESPIAIAILTDADATDSVAEADYDDFSLCRPLPPDSPKPASEPSSAPKR